MIVEHSAGTLDDRGRASALERFGSPLAARRPRVLFWLPHGIGDAVLAGPAVSGLRGAYPDARIELAFFRSASRSVLAGHPAIDETHLLHPRRPVFLRQLLRLRRRFDVVVVPGGLTLWKHRVPISLIAPRACAGVWPRHQGRPWFSHGVIAARGAHETTLIAEALRQALPRVTAGSPLVAFRPEDHRDAEELWKRCRFDDRPVLAIATGCEPSTPYKRWPLARFVEVVRRFLEAHPEWRVWAPLGPGEEQHAPAWDVLADERVRVTRDVPLGTVAAALGRCRLVLANDSALAHLAAVSRVPSVVIFGPTDPTLTHPLGASWSAITASGCDRQPCFPHFGEPFDPRRCPNRFVCLDAIGVEPVLAALERASRLEVPLATSAAGFEAPRIFGLGACPAPVSLPRDRGFAASSYVAAEMAPASQSFVARNDPVQP